MDSYPVQVTETGRIRIGVAEDESFDLKSQPPVRISYFTKISFKICTMLEREYLCRPFGTRL